jgi:hypothetical protein
MLASPNQPSLSRQSVSATLSSPAPSLSPLVLPRPLKAGEHEDALVIKLAAVVGLDA